MTRVLLLIKGLGRGGAEQLLASAAPYLDTTRFEYEVAYLLPWKNALVGELETNGLLVHCLEGARGTSWIRRLVGLVRERGIDIVHAHSPYAAIGARLAFRGRPTPRLVYTEHNVWERYQRATYWLNALTYRRNDHVFAVSDHVRASLRHPWPLRFLRMPPAETLYHGLDRAAVARWGASDGVREELGIREDAPVVGTVANLKAHKGHRNLLHAAVKVRAAVPDVRFVFVGQGPLEDDLRRGAGALGLSETVVFAGYREDAPRVAGAFDVFALASVHEGLSIALIEAMALGMPAVVTGVGGLVEVVEDGKQGLVVPPADPGTLADAIITLLLDPSLRARMGAAARQRAVSFDIRKAVRRIEEVYEELAP